MHTSIRDKTEVPGGFDRAAAKYDFLTSLNPGYHKHLRMSARRLAAPPRARLLDLCCGTGASTKALLSQYPEARITALDASAEMLARARQKPELSRVRFLHGDATDPAAWGAGGPYDAIFMAYGIRNVSDADTCLRNILSLLVAGGRVCFHEYSVADSRFATLVWNIVLRAIIIPSAYFATGSTDIYRYLGRSVLEFDGIRAFQCRLKRAGYCDVYELPMTGWQRGIVHSFLARRPS